MGLVDKSEVVTLKGRAAAEIDTADELVTTELLFSGVLKNLEIPKMLALISCLVPVERTTETIHLTESLAEPLAQLQVGLQHAVDW